MALLTPPADHSYRDFQRSNALSSEPSASQRTAVQRPSGSEHGGERTQPRRAAAVQSLGSCLPAGSCASCVYGRAAFWACFSLAQAWLPGQALVPMDHAVCGCSFTFGFNEERVGGFFLLWVPVVRTAVG